MRTRRPERLRGFSYVGFHRYSLTFTTLGRARAFTTHDVVDRTLSQILRAAMAEAFDVIAYCFMPDHVHIVAAGASEHSDLNAFIKRGKQLSGYDYKQRTGTRLWQPYPYEHVLRDDESLARTVRYVLENPVRAGVVKDLREYLFLGSGVYTLGQLLDFAFERRPARRPAPPIDN
jgi:putative transposase